MKLSLITGQEFYWKSFWAETESFWEAVFTTWVTWYELTLTDPSFKDQIVIFTQPLIWNYWIPWEDRDEYWILKNFESEKIWAKWVIVCEYSENYSHWKAVTSLWEWLKKQWIPWITWVDTRDITKILRNQWSTLWWIINDNSKLPPLVETKHASSLPNSHVISSELQLYDPNEKNIVWECSIKEVKEYNPINWNGKTIIAYDFWMKNNILREFLRRWVKVIRVPFNFDLEEFISNKRHCEEWNDEAIHSKNCVGSSLQLEPGSINWLFLSNWPWDPAIVAPFVTKSIQYAINNNIPTFWICLWNQLLWLSIWAKTEKMPYGHRWINQPCINLDTNKCYITSQNHWFHIKEKSLPSDWQVWWKNANDWTVEWIRHKTKNFKSIQFHPESFPWPEDTNFLFDEFIWTL